MVNCQTHMFRKIIILLYYNIRIVVTGVVKCQPNIIIYFRFFFSSALWQHHVQRHHGHNYVSIKFKYY